MTEQQAPPSGPDLTRGVTLADFAGGRLVGHVADEEVLLVLAGAELFAIGAHCSHYHGPLGEGIVVGESVRCPWHHACFDLRSGEAVRAPALSPVDCWKVERDGERIFVGKSARSQAAPCGSARRSRAGSSSSAAAPRVSRRPRCCGGAAFAAASSMLSDDAAPPVDRPNLSKDYLAGSAPEDWLPLRPDAFYAENDIDLRLGAAVTGIDVEDPRRHARRRREAAYDRLLAGDRRRTGPAADPGRGREACPYAALARGLPRHHRRGRQCAARARHRRELHRARGCGGAARTRHRGACRRAGSAADGARARAARSATSSARCTKSTASCFICRTP